MNRSLFALTDDAARMEETILSIIDEGDEQFAESLFQFLDQAREDIEEKIDRLAYILREMRIRAEALREESKRLRDLSGVEYRKIARLEAYIKSWLESQSKTRAVGKVRSISVVSNGGALPLVWRGPNGAPDVGSIPDEYLRTRVVAEPDQEKIREALDSGVELSFVSYGDRGTRVVVK